MKMFAKTVLKNSSHHKMRIFLKPFSKSTEEILSGGDGGMFKNNIW
jgi:hypothetical protein